VLTIRNTKVLFRTKLPGKKKKYLELFKTNDKEYYLLGYATM
jgi:hypothetical protein